IPFRGELLEREQRRRTRDSEVVGQRSRRWESRARLGDAVENGTADLRVDLLLQRTAGAAIDADEKIGCSVNRHDRPSVVAISIVAMEGLFIRPLIFPTIQIFGVEQVATSHWRELDLHTPRAP